MKASSLIISILFVILALLASASAQARVEATIPFDFTAANQTFPAGEYRLTMVRSMLQVERLDGSRAVFVQSFPAHYKQDAPGRIIFHRYGDHYFLSQAWIEDICHQLAASSRELQYARTDKQDKLTIGASTVAAK